ncbi:MAG: putative toxin-antitoxin system toxin component, PIN family [Acidobacteriota bacterium]|nr:putative toxin-antitoxin system toxin component, PIN family [Acidobacteriota bacterium]
MKVIIDTNVVVSAALKDRTPEEVILFVVGQEDFEWIVSSAIVEEYNEVLGREKFRLPVEVLRKWCEMFEQLTTMLDVEIEVDFPRDRKDAKFLECALAADADFLITGDKDFTEAQKIVRTVILSVSQFKHLVMEAWS